MICHFSSLSHRRERAAHTPSVLRPVTLHRDDNMGAEVLHPHRQPAGAAQPGEGGEVDVTEKGYFPCAESRRNLVCIALTGMPALWMINRKRVRRAQVSE